MNNSFGDAPRLRFETRASKPRVFRITNELIAEAMARRDARAEVSLGEDLADLDGLSKADGFIASLDIVCDLRFPRRDLARVAPRLRWIHVTGAGIEPLLPLDWLPAGVTLTNNSGVHVEKTRESATMLLLMCNARIPAMAHNQASATWRQIFTSTIHGKTVLIVGVGEMGGAVASSARQLGLRVLGVRRGGEAHPDVDTMYRLAELDHALPLADFVVLCAPLTSETAGLLDARRMGLMKPGASLINIGRAGLVDHDALMSALTKGAIACAIIDVYDPEPLPAGSPLWNAPNLLLMPHVSSDDEDRYLPKTLDLVFENAERLARGAPLLNVVDPRLGY